MFKSIKFALFGMLSMCLMMATEKTPAADASAVTNPVHEGIVARVEAALKSGVSWIESHFHALLDNIETAIDGGTPQADPTPPAATAEQTQEPAATSAALASSLVTDTGAAVQAEAPAASTAPQSESAE